MKIWALVPALWRPGRSAGDYLAPAAVAAAFGNLVAARSRTLLDGEEFFAEPSVGVAITWPYEIDVDLEHDVKLAEAVLAAGQVRLPHMDMPDGEA